MAELGNLFGGGEANEAKIEVEMLDYGYIGDCKDWSVVSAILDVLKSGKEGHYPDLIRFAEEKLVDLLPPKEKKRYMSLSHNTTPSEIAEAEADLQAWRKSVMAKDAQVKAGDSRGVPHETKIKAPVRGAGHQRTGESETKRSDSTGIHECDDADVFAMLNGNQRKRLERLQLDLGVSELSTVKRQYKANLEKTKGNESFHIADNNDAVTCYSNSLAYDARNAVVWANRAMAYIRLELFDLAEADSTVALHLDPAYVKAYSRRGLVRFKRGKYAEAVQDFKQALQLDPLNAKLQELLATARVKYLEVEGVPLDSIPTEEVDVEEEHAGGNAGATPAGHARTHQATAVSYEYVQLSVVQSSTELLLPGAGAELVCEGSLLVAVPPLEGDVGEGNQNQARFVRVSIVSEDSDSDNESESGGASEPVKASASFCRVAITEDDDSSSDEDENGGAGGVGATQSVLSVEEKERQVEVLKEEGNRLMKAGQLQDAVGTYTRCLDLLPTYLPALNNRAQAHISMKSFGLAAKDCTAVLALDPGNPKALYRRAVALHALNDIAGTLADLDAILRVDPSNVPAKQLQNQVQQQQQQSAALRKQESLPVPPAMKATAVVPPPAEVPQFDAQKLKQRAQQLLGDGLNDKVIALLAQYLRAVDEPPFCELMQSDQTSLLHLLATAYSSTEDYQHAVAVQETILRLDPTNFRALYKRAENQLQLATQLKGDGRTAALELAEQDIAAALKVQSNADVLALRQRLLRLRNTAPETGTQSSPAAAVPAAASAARSASTQPSSSRQQSDAQKELGNTAMAEKHYSTAVMHYSNAIQFDATNLAAVNNRALAHLKLNDFAKAEADATCVVDAKQADESAEGVQSLRLKALCRRAQARRSMGEQLFSGAKGTKDAIKGAQDKFDAAMQDLLQLLRDDANNKTALVEQKAVKDALKRCSDELAPPATIASKKTPQPSPSAGGKTVEAKAASNTGASNSNVNNSVSSPVPRADPSRVSAMLSPSTASTPSFGDIGLVARTTKKLRSDGKEDGTATPSAPSTPVPAGQTSDSPSKTAGSSGMKKEKAVSCPPPSIILTTAPTEPPKTVYEFERVWRGLKGRPDLFAQYIACFKKSTFKKVLKDSVSPDLVSFMWTALRDHALSPEVQLKALTGFSAAPSFALTLSMLPAQDLACVKAIVTSLAVHANSTTDEAQRSILTQSIIDLRATYGFE